jgi:site-specific recombinase XerD
LPRKTTKESPHGFGHVLYWNGGRFLQFLPHRRSVLPDGANSLNPISLEKQLMKLQEIFEQYFLPRLLNKERNENTISNYRRTVKYWESILNSPDIENITETHIYLFKKGLRNTPGLRPGTLMSDNTVRKHLRTLRPLLNLAGNKDMHNKHGLGILEEVPELEPPAEIFRNAKDRLSINEITAWIQAAKNIKQKSISGIPAGVWWENLLVFIYNTGARIGSALQIRWNWIDFENTIIMQEKKPGIKTTSPIVLRNCLQIAFCIEKGGVNGLA